MIHTEITQLLLRWYAAHGRDLPWRHTRDPYAIWLSEIILQQTRISQGTAYWQRFMDRFPTVHHLAAASEDEVMRLWQGLGYYSRARHLHEAARQVVALGSFPDTLDGLKKLSGVGDYTAAAIAAFAYGMPTAAVDGNFYRVLARVFGIDTPVNTTEGHRLFQAIADNLVIHSDVNAAVMDFGATQCTPQSPACATCMLAEHCEALRQGRVDQLPVKIKTVKMKTRRLSYIYIRCNGYTAIHRRGEGDIWQGLWEPPLFENQPMPQWEGRFTQTAHDVKHVLTHRILMADCFLLETTQKPQLPDDFIWIREEDMDQYAIPRLVELLLDTIPQPDTRHP